MIISTEFFGIFSEIFSRPLRTGECDDILIIKLNTKRT
jgi:hypothetical protein